MFHEFTATLKKLVLAEPKATYSLPISCIAVGVGLGYLIKLSMDYLHHKSNRTKNAEKQTEIILSQLLIEYMNRGWRPKQLQFGKESQLSLFLSFYKPALVGTSSTVLIENSLDHNTYLLLNIQNRKVGDVMTAVADFPCGFHQSELPTNHEQHQKTIDRFNTLKKTLGRKPTQTELIQAIYPLKSHSLTPLNADRSIFDTARRETSEETGLNFSDPIIQSIKTREEGTISFNCGSYFIHSIIFHITSNGLPLLIPQRKEGILKCAMIPLQNSNFSFSKQNEDDILGKVKLSDNSWYPIKPYDKTPQRLLHQLENFGLFFNIQSGGFPIADSAENLDCDAITSHQISTAVATLR